MRIKRFFCWILGCSWSAGYTMVGEVCGYTYYQKCRRCKEVRLVQGCYHEDCAWKFEKFMGSKVRRSASPAWDAHGG